MHDEGLERATIEPRKRHLKLHIAPFIGRVKLAELTRRGLTPSSINSATPEFRAMRSKILTSLGGALSFAKGQGLVAQNVAMGSRCVRTEGTG